MNHNTNRLWRVPSSDDGPGPSPNPRRSPDDGSPVDRVQAGVHQVSRTAFEPPPLEAETAWRAVDLGQRVEPDRKDGLSLLPFCRGAPPGDWREEAHWEYDFRDVVDQKHERALGLASDQCTMNVIRGPRYKYVHFTALPPLFFDLQTDPWEFRNLADDPAHRDQVLSYAQKLLSWRMNHDERVLANQKLTPDGVIERKGPRR